MGYEAFAEKKGGERKGLPSGITKVETPNLTMEEATFRAMASALLASPEGTYSDMQKAGRAVHLSSNIEGCLTGPDAAASFFQAIANLPKISSVPKLKA